MIDLLLLIMVCLGNIALGLFVLLNNPKSKINISLFLLTISIAFWNVISFLPDTSISSNYINIISKLDFATATILVFLFTFFCFSIARMTSRVVFFSFGAFAAINLYLITSGQTIHVAHEGTRIIYQPDRYYMIFIIYLALAVMASLGVLAYKFTKLKGASKLQIQYLLTGLSLTVFTIIVTNIVLPNVIDILPIVSRIGIYSTSIFIIFSSYAIIRHKLFDIRAAVARSVVYLLSIITVAAIYSFLAFRIITLFADRLSQNTQYAIYTILAVVLAFTFQPLRRFFERVTDRIFFRDKYDPQVVLNNISHILASEIRLTQLSEDIVKAIKTQMRIAGADIVVVDDKEIFYKTRPIVGPHHEIGMSELGKLAKSVVVADELSPGERKQIMSDYGLSVSLALRTHEQFLGYLLLGEKQSGDIYSDADLKLLRIIADELAIAITNAKSYAEIQQFNETLQTKIAWATQKLRHANEDLKALDQAKDEFISMASHQLRTPLTTTKGYVSMVLEGDFGRISTSQRDPLSQALDSANRMAGLVSDLLNVSRMDAGKFFIDAHELDLAKVVQSEFNGLISMAQSKNVKLTLEPLPKSLPLINLDEEKTRQVIMNLIDNAIHYSSPAKNGGDVCVSLKKVGNKAVFTVVDNGIGVPEKMQGKLFTKFYRAANAQASRPDGTGLGLYLVKRVVEDQGGELIFKSTEGKGSTFGFRFPLRTKFKTGVTKARVPTST